MSDAVLAAMIAAGATVLTSLLQLKASIKREVAARAQLNAPRRKARGPFLLLTIMLVGAAVGGFSLAQWMMERERAQELGMRRELQDRVTAADEVLQTRAEARDEIETGVLRRQGAEGTVAITTVAACKAHGGTSAAMAASSTAAAGLATTALAAVPATPSAICAEAEATQVLLCAPIPARASVASVELYSRFADSDMPWSAARSLPGQELEQARFSEKPVELPGDDSTKHICHGFANWSTLHARVARMVVRFTL